MGAIAKYIKETTPNAKVVFIGPCTAKKAEVQLDSVKPYVDAAMTFEELQALFDSRDIDITTLDESELNNASYFGRIGGAGCLTHGPKNKTQVDNYGMEAYEKTILEAVSVLDLVKPATPVSNPE